MDQFQFYLWWFLLDLDSQMGSVQKVSNWLETIVTTFQRQQQIKSMPREPASKSVRAIDKVNKPCILIF